MPAPPASGSRNYLPEPRKKYRARRAPIVPNKHRNNLRDMEFLMGPLAGKEPALQHGTIRYPWRAGTPGRALRKASGRWQQRPLRLYGTPAVGGRRCGAVGSPGGGAPHPRAAVGRPARGSRHPARKTATAAGHCSAHHSEQLTSAADCGTFSQAPPSVAPAGRQR
jgi:hypothetical protein